MGNKFGNYASENDAIMAIEVEGFTLRDNGYWGKSSVTGGSLIDAPRACTALVEITSYRVDGQYAPDGRDYRIWQHHFI